MKDLAIKERIIDVAARLFYEQGYNQTGINQVIEEADIARGTLYNHFESKTDLLLAYLDRFQQNWFAGLEEFLRPITDPRKKVLALFDYRIKSQQNGGFCGCPFIKISAEIGEDDSNVIKMVRENKRVFKSQILKLVMAVKHKQVLNSQSLTDMIYLLMEGGVISAAIYKNTKELENGKSVVALLL